MENLIVSILLPAITYAVGFVVNMIRKAIGASPLWMSVAIPAVGALVSLVDSQLATSTLPFSVKIGLTLAATFIHELYNNLKQG